MPHNRWRRTSEGFARREQYDELLATTAAAAYGSWDEGVNVTVLETLAWGLTAQGRRTGGEWEILVLAFTSSCPASRWLPLEATLAD